MLKHLKKSQPKHPDASHSAIHNHASPMRGMGKAKTTDKGPASPKKKIGSGKRKV